MRAVAGAPMQSYISLYIASLAVAITTLTTIDLVLIDIHHAQFNSVLSHELMAVPPNAKRAFEGRNALDLVPALSHYRDGITCTVRLRAEAAATDAATDAHARSHTSTRTHAHAHALHVRCRCRRVLSGMAEE